jgi:hypothetical protein
VLNAGTTPTCVQFDPSYGDLYVVYYGGTLVHKFNPTGEQVAEFALSARAENAELFFVVALAVDGSGRLAVSEREFGGRVALPFGSLLDGVTGRLVTEFPVLGSDQLGALAFSAGDEMYGSENVELLSYDPVPVAELLAAPGSCMAGAEHVSDATFDCALNGEANPEEVPDTEVSFQWGATPKFGEATPVQVLCTSACGNALVAVAPAGVEGLAPNETVYYRLTGHDQNVTAPELLTSDATSLKTPAVVPRVLGSPSASFVSSSSAVLVGEVNPENAPTQYFFEYGSELGGYCEGALRTNTLQSAAYGQTAGTFEASGLQPETTYRYRLCATDTAGNATDETGKGEVRQGTFVTAPAAVPRAVTGSYTALGSSVATITGTVNPDGQPATYAFELGLYNAGETGYGVVFSGAAGAGSTPVEETLALTGLQPGTTYAYRVKVTSGYGTAYGATATFTTAGLPSVLVTPIPLALLAVPNISFPTPLTPAPVTKALTRAQRLARALKACTKKPKKQRAACRRRARKQFAKSKQANQRKKG